jgi:hypothetical protein
MSSNTDKKTTDAETKAKADAEAKAKTEAKSKAEAKAKTDAEAKSKTDTDTKATTDTDTKATTDTDAKATTDAEEKTEAKEPSVFDKDNYLDKNTLMLTASFLAIYFIIYAILGIFYDGSDPTHHSSKAGFTDIIILIIIVVIGSVYYYSLPASEQDTYWTDLLKLVKDYLNNAYSIMEVGLFILFLYVGIYFFKIPMNPVDKPMAVAFLESKAFILLFILLFVQFFKYVLKIDVIGVIFGDIKVPDLKPESKDGSKKISTISAVKDEVYNISNNLYSYEDAKAVCKAMGSRLATYDEVEDAYNNGAEWSTYGWSEDQHAYFPTQKETWAKLQKVKGHEHDLGRPGVNGGYFSNPNVRFGVNCYGVKPPMTDAEKALMDARKDHVYPKTKEDQALDTKVEFWKANRDKMLVLNGYNTKAWSRY